MNLTVLDFWELWLPITYVVHFAFEFQVTTSLWTFGIPLDYTIVTKLEKVNKQENSSIINKFRFNYIIGGTLSSSTDIWKKTSYLKRTDVDFDLFFFPSIFSLFFYWIEIPDHFFFVLTFIPFWLHNSSLLINHSFFSTTNITSSIWNGYN